MDKPLEMRDDTREKLLQAALEQFAERGFYGASIAQIAGELDLTKQALLYYFKRKEDLYSEVLKRISERLQSVIKDAVSKGAGPDVQFEDMVLAVYEESIAHPEGTKVLMRELLDNQRRDAAPDTWYLKTFLDAMVAHLDGVDHLASLPAAGKVACVYQMISAIEFFVASRAVLERFYGPEEYAAIVAAYPRELRSQVRRLIQRA